MNELLLEVWTHSKELKLNGEVIADTTELTAEKLLDVLQKHGVLKYEIEYK